MKFIKFSKTEKFDKEEGVTTWEYTDDDKDINLALAQVFGRFPKAGYAVNDKCKEMAYITKGNGKIVVKDGKEFEFGEKDMILVEPGEEYYWEGDFEMAIPCAPAWTPEQHRRVD